MSQTTHPVAWMFQHAETGNVTFIDSEHAAAMFEQKNPRWSKAIPLAPLQADLLAAVQALLSMPDFDGSQETSEARRSAKRLARAAIAKATGGET
jgi:hypothetical protein